MIRFEVLRCGYMSNNTSPVCGTGRQYKMQLAIIGSKEEILEVMRFVERMQITGQGEQVIRAEFKTKVEERKQLQFENVLSPSIKIG